MIWETCEEIPKINSIQDLLVVYGTNRPKDSLLSNSILTKDEIAFGNRIRDINQRNTWISCHVTLRIMLGTFLKSDPAGVELKKNRFGRLYLAKSDLYFNLSHTNSSWLMGFSFGGKIGVDLENLTGNEDLASLVAYAFSSVETNYCQNGDLADRFLEIWTLKEAFLKAAGVGLVDNLAKINVIGYEGNDLDLRKFNQKTFICPNGETASIVYRNNKTLPRYTYVNHQAWNTLIKQGIKQD
jgi:phosphopantetheinyl transferase